MTGPYYYLSRPGASITVDRHGNGCDDADLTVCGGPSGGTVRVRKADVPAVAAGIAMAMHWAAGLPAPVILERPAHPRASLEFCGVTYSLQGGRILVDRKPGPRWGGELRTPADIRRAAGRLAALADEAEPDEPDPAEAEELAMFLHDAREAGVKGTPGEWDRAAARAALRWFRDRETP